MAPHIPHTRSIHVDHAMSTGNQSVNGRRWNGGADGTVVQMEQMEIHQWVFFLIFEKIFTGFVGPPSPSTLCAGPAYPPSIDPTRHESMGAGSQDQQQPGEPGSAAAQAAQAARAARISSSPGSQDQQQPGDTNGNPLFAVADTKPVPTVNFRA